ncbi:MAG TPA: sigma-54 dependent transcriptional regulator [Edaphocola sp.]|nr:sigma-54 dependent transcriptional regulator [Edaphocola sp.]
MAKTILIIDDERSIRVTLSEILSFEGYQAELATDGEDGLKKLRDRHFDCIICDIKMPRMDGMEVFEKAREICPEVPFILISGHGTIETAVDAVKKGAFDFVSKPPDLNRLLITLRNALERKSLVSEANKLKNKISAKEEIIGASPVMKAILEMVDKVAPTDARVLVTGPNGSGKELIAKRIHKLSNRSQQEIVEVNCAAIPSELIESELFGHEKGSFTSAVKQRIGKFEQADGGTLFLDEIGDMSLSAQAKVLRALQEGRITRVGGDKEIKVNVRVIAATNKDLQKEIEAGNFREDLYHRLSVICIQVPSLNERVADIAELSNHFLKEICKDYNMPIKEIDGSALKKMEAHNWTGNIRELRNAIERLVILCDKKITKKDVETHVFIN